MSNPEITPTYTPSSEALSSRDENPDKDEIPGKLLAKLDIRILPPLMIVDTMSFLDRVNIGNALIYRLEEDLHLQGYQTNTALAIVFVSYVLFDIPAMIIMKRIGPCLFLFTITFSFGLVVTMQGLLQSYGGLLTTRFLIGLFEAGMYPACSYLLSTWYPRRQAQTRFTGFTIGGTLGACFGGLIASGIGHLDGMRGYSAWRWLFILEGSMTCVLALLSYPLLTGFPEDAKWITETERSIILTRIRKDQGDSDITGNVTLRDIYTTLSDWKVLISAPLYFCINVSSYGLAFFTPTIVASYGHPPIRAQLFTALPYAFSFTYAMLVAYLSDRIQMRFPFVLAGFTLALIGNVIVTSVQDNKLVDYIGIIIYGMGTFSNIPLSVCWVTWNLRTHKQRVVGIPWMIGLGNTAGALGSFAFPKSGAPRYILGYSLGLGFICLGMVVTISYFLSLTPSTWPSS